jgi:hypothetical protein
MKNKPRLPNSLKPTILAFYESKIEENVDLADAILDEYSINDRFIAQLAPLLFEVPFFTRHYTYYIYWRGKSLKESTKSYSRSKSSLKYVNK